VVEWDAPSPFIYDGPVPPDRLIGREHEALVLRQWAAAGRFTALTAPRRYGKTSLIGKVAADAEAQDHTAVVVADLYDVASMADLVIRLERAWATHTPSRLRTAVSRVLAGAQVGLSISGTGFTMALADRPQTDPLPALHTLLDLPTKIAGKGDHQRVLVVLDEFQSVGRVPGAEALIRSHAQHHRAVASYLFAGSEPSMLAAAFAETTRPFYGQAENFRLGRLGAEQLTEAILGDFERTEKHPGDVLPALIDVAQGHPQRAMLLAHLLWTRTSPGAVADGQTWTQTLEAALRRIDPEARAVLSGMTPAERKTLRAVAEYGSPLSARALRTLALPKSTAQTAAAALVGSGHLEHGTGEEWSLVDPLLALWIRTELGTRTVL